MAKETDSEIRAFALRQIKKKQGFRTYLYVYAAVTLIVVGVWFFTSPGSYFWPQWAIFGMGIAAVFIGLDAYGIFGPKPISEADIDAEVERLGRKG